MGKTNIRWKKTFIVAAIVALIGLVGFSQQSQAAVGTNQQISFQGKVVNTNGTNLADGTYNMRFKVYQDGTGCQNPVSDTPPCGGTLKWTETRLVSATQGVTVTAGTFQVNLGAITAFASNVDWNQDTLWLSFEIGGTATTPVWDNEMEPFIRFTSVPYALNSNMVGGLTASQLVQLTPSSQQTGTINVSGNIQTGGTLQAATIDRATSGVLTVGSTNTTGVTLGKNVTVTSGQTLTMGGQQVISGTGILQAAAISSSVAYTNLTQIGTVTTGTWSATTIAANKGGTGQTGYAVGDLLYADTTTTLAKRIIGSTGQCLTVAGGLPTWGSCATGSGVTTVGNFVASGTDGNGATISGTTITFQGATGTVPGMVTASGTQTFAGLKQFTGGFKTTGTATIVSMVAQGDTGFVNNIAEFRGGGGGLVARFTNGGYLELQSGFGSSFSTNTNFTANAFTVTSTASSGNVTLQAANMTVVGAATTGATTLIGFNFPSVTPIANNYFAALTMGTGYNVALQVAGNDVIDGNGQVLSYGLVNANYVVGDVLYAASTTNLGRLAAGTSGTCLKSNGAAAPVYGTCIASVGVYSTSNTNAAGATISGSTITFQNASVSAPGMLNNAAQSIGGNKTFVNGVTVGSTTTDATQVNAQLDSYSTYADSGTCSTTTNQGALYYNTATNAVRACTGGAWEDLVSTGGLGLALFGVVPDSGSNPGDLQSLATAGASGPCKVSAASATTITLQACTVYTGGRKVIQPQVTITLPAMAVNTFTHLCYYNGGVATGPITNSTAWFTTPNTNEAANMPTFSATSPVVCLAMIRNSATVANTISQVYSLRPFTTSQKTFAYASALITEGSFVITTSTDSGKITTATATTTRGVTGVSATGASAAWASGGPNAILITGGPAEVKTLSGAINAYNYLIPSASAAYASATTTAPTAGTPPISLGIARTAFQSCASISASTCQGSVLVNIQFM